MHHRLLTDTCSYSASLEKVKLQNKSLLFKAPFWIQVHNMPLGFISLAGGTSIANFFGWVLRLWWKEQLNLLETFHASLCLTRCQEYTKENKEDPQTRKGGHKSALQIWKAWFFLLCLWLARPYRRFMQSTFLPEIRVEAWKPGGYRGSKYLHRDDQPNKQSYDHNQCAPDMNNRKDPINCAQIIDDNHKRDALILLVFKNP